MSRVMAFAWPFVGVTGKAPLQRSHVRSTVCGALSIPTGGANDIAAAPHGIRHGIIALSIAQV